MKAEHITHHIFYDIQNVEKVTHLFFFLLFSEMRWHGEKEWPSRSPDLTPDFFLWGLLKDLIYRLRPKTVIIVYDLVLITIDGFQTVSPTQFYLHVWQFPIGPYTDNPSHPHTHTHTSWSHSLLAKSTMASFHRGTYWKFPDPTDNIVFRNLVTGIQIWLVARVKNFSALPLTYISISASKVIDFFFFYLLIWEILLHFFSG